MTEGPRPRLLLANAVTLFGTAFAFVPLGAYFHQALPDGLGFPAFLVARLLPGLALAPLYARWADRRSPRYVITVSQLAAALTSVALVAAVHAGQPGLALLIGAVGIAFGSALKGLFPGLLRREASGAGEVHRALSTWYGVRAAALLVATAAGGWLQQAVGLELFLAVDAATFLFAFVVWRTVPDTLLAAPVTPVAAGAPSRAEFLGAANVANFWRNVFFGLFGALFPTFVLGAQGGGPRALGGLYAAVGLATVVGAAAARAVRPGLASALGLAVVELLLVGWAVSTTSFAAFLVPVALACAAVAASEVALQTAFVGGGDPARAHARSAAFQATENAASLAGAVVAAALAPWHLAPPQQLLGAVGFAVLSMATLVVGRRGLRGAPGQGRLP